jgi:FeoB-associated Cys-rich membrane protein
MGQQLIVAAIVLTAAAFIARRMWRAVASARASKQAGCDSGCGCAPQVQPPKRQRADQHA